MAISRKDALKRLNGLALRVREHLHFLEEEPDSQDAAHWRGETRSWLDQMEAMLVHVGKTTGAHWAEKIAQWRSELEEQAHGD